jgi:hypothetical protein
VLSRFAGNGGQILQVFEVVHAGTGVLDGFPGCQQAQDGETPALEASKVFVGLPQRKRATDEGDFPMIEETLGAVGSAIRSCGNLGCSAQVHPTQDQPPAVFIPEPGAIDVDHPPCS